MSPYRRGPPRWTAAARPGAGEAGEIPGLGVLDWMEVGRRLDEDGFAMTPPLLSAQQCADVSAMFDDEQRRLTLLS